MAPVAHGVRLALMAASDWLLSLTLDPAIPAVDPLLT
jgi:hypothetical protein